MRVRFEDAPGAEATGAKPDAVGDRDQVASARHHRLDASGTVILREGVLFAGASDRLAEPSDLNPDESVPRDLIVYADRGS